MAVTIIHCTDGDLAVIPPVARVLQIRGDVLDVNGRLISERSKAEIMTLVGGTGPAAVGVCDFCSAPNPEITFETVDFEMYPGRRSTGGWAACHTCAELVRANDRQRLLRRAIEAYDMPADADIALAVKAAIAELHQQFWNNRVRSIEDVRIPASRAVGDIIEDEGELVDAREWREKSASSFRKLCEEVRLSRRIVEAEIDDMQARKLIAFRRTYNRERFGDVGFATHILVKSAKDDLTPRQRAIILAIERLYGADYRSGKLTPDDVAAIDQKQRPGEHTYMRAIELQYRALANFGVLLDKARRAGRTHIDGWNVREQFEQDIHLLKHAETFCWFDETMQAAQAAAATLPTSVRLTRELTNGEAGWWYFIQPIDVVTTTQENDGVRALLWGWTMYGDTPGVYFASYVFGSLAELGMQPIPTTKFFWREGVRLSDAMVDASIEYDRLYNNPDIPEKMKHGPMAPLGKEHTLGVVERQLRIFAAGCLWIQQRILTISKGHIERHERKRLDKTKQFARPVSDVQIIQLRRKESVAVAAKPDGKTVDWKCRWIVSGHWRNQYHPSSGKHEPTWIHAYPKGPDHLPLKVPTHRVYVVNR